MRSVAVLVFCTVLGAAGKQKPAPESPLDQLIRETSRSVPPAGAAPGSLWSTGVPLGDLAQDLRARRVHDLVTVVVADRASAIARGTTRSARSAQAKAGINAIAGTPPLGNRLPNLLNIGGDSSLDGEGETSRETVLTTTLTARVTHVLPNGNLVVEGAKSVRVNSETQNIAVRGIVRPVDLSPGNSISSDRLGLLEISVNGKGVVGDAIKR